MGAPHVMLFDLYHGGHRGQYVRQLIEYWGTHQLPGRLSVVARKDFFALHADVSQAAREHETAGTQCIPITEPDPLRGFMGSVRAHGRLLKRYAQRIRPTHAVAMYFDQLQLSLAAGLRFNYPVALSGIYFRPTFHYRPRRRRTPGERFVSVRKRYLLHAALRNPHFTTLFCLDPHVIPHVSAKHAQLVPLPDGVPQHRMASGRTALRTALRTAWGVKPRRRIALFFGSLAARKGIYQTLAALPQLSPAHQHQLALIIIGQAVPRERAPMQSRIAASRSTTAVQIIHEPRFVREEEIPRLFQSADLILAPYQRHVGSSGVLIRAAQAGVPVLGSDYGLVGTHIVRHQLGLAVDSTQPAAIAAGLTRWLSGNPIPFDKGTAAAFGMANTADQFCRTIFGALLRHGSMEHDRDRLDTGR